MAQRVVHLELHTGDLARARAFYAGLLAVRWLKATDIWAGGVGCFQAPRQNSDDREHTIGFKRNSLMQQSRGTYVNFLDDDDDVHAPGA